MVFVNPNRRLLLVPMDQRIIERCQQHNIEVHSKTFRGERMLMLPHTLEVVRALDDLCVLPGPIQYYYDWPGRHAPFEKQKLTADFLTRHMRAYVFNEIGTGKTLSSLWAADYLWSVGDLRGAALVLAPLSTLQVVWGDEIWATFPGRRSAVMLYGTRTQRIAALSAPADFYILNHDGLKVFLSTTRDGQRVRTKAIKEFETFLARIELIIVDEGAVFRNARTDLWRALAAIADGKRIWWLTGAPMPRAPTDIWAQARIVTPHLVPRYFGQFRDLTMQKVSQFKWVPRPGWEQTVHQMVRPAIRFRRDECLDIREPMYAVRQVELSVEQEQVAQSLIRQYMAELAAGTLTAANEGVRRNKLLQVYGGAVYLDDGGYQMLDVTPRLRELENIAEQAGAKLLVFAVYDHHVALLARHLGRRHKIATVTGQTSSSARTEIFRQFQAGDLEILIANPGTMAHGLTLTAANVIVWWSPTDDFEAYEQANGRITRPGQQRQPLIIMLQASRLEAEIYRRLRLKQSLQGLLLSLLEAT